MESMAWLGFRGLWCGLGTTEVVDHMDVVDGNFELSSKRIDSVILSFSRVFGHLIVFLRLGVDRMRSCIIGELCNCLLAYSDFTTKKCGNLGFCIVNADLVLSIISILRRSFGGSSRALYIEHLSASSIPRNRRLMVETAQ